MSVFDLRKLTEIRDFQRGDYLKWDGTFYPVEKISTTEVRKSLENADTALLPEKYFVFVEDHFYVAQYSPNERGGPAFNTVLYLSPTRNGKKWVSWFEASFPSKITAQSIGNVRVYRCELLNIDRVDLLTSRPKNIDLQSVLNKVDLVYNRNVDNVMAAKIGKLPAVNTRTILDGYFGGSSRRRKRSGRRSTRKNRKTKRGKKTH